MRAIEDATVLALFQAQRAPTAWAVYRVFLYGAHLFQRQEGSTRCEECGIPEDPHLQNRQMRIVILMKNGPLRHVSLYAEDARELSPDARQWLSTLYNLAEAAGVGLDGWLAYDARG